MKKYYLLLIALLLIVVDVRISTVSYPAFEEFKTEAPETVSLVIDHVLGHTLKADIFSDVAGYILLAIASVMLGLKNKRFLKTLMWTGLALGAYVFRYAMPFILNGHDRFQIGYGIYFVAAALEAIVVFSAMYSLCHQLESTENHSYNNITVIVAMLSMGTGLVAAVIYFFGFIVVPLIYYLIQIATFVIYWILVRRDKKMLVAWEEQDKQNA